MMLCAAVNAVMALTSWRSVRGDEDEAKHEEKVVVSEQDVLDAEPEK